MCTAKLAASSTKQHTPPSAHLVTLRAVGTCGAKLPSTWGVKGWPGAQVQMVDADRCGVRMSGDGALTPHRVTSGSVVSSSNGLARAHHGTSGSRSG